jgi:hydroxymethylglutaryl-CoA lyase
LRGAQEASAFERIAFLGYPFSISETFQLRNTNANIQSATSELSRIKDVADARSKNVIVYLSMAFGNPYGDYYHPDLVIEHLSKLKSMGFEHFALADTVGIASAEHVSDLISRVSESFTGLPIGVHLHCKPENWHQKLASAYAAGCRQFDVALGGYGGCPMAGDSLVGNLSTEWLVQYFESNNVPLKLNKESLAEAQAISKLIFSSEHPTA